MRKTAGGMQARAGLLRKAMGLQAVLTCGGQVETAQEVQSHAGG